MKPGIYRHADGGIVRVLFVANDATSGRNRHEPFVVHIWLSGPFAGNCYVRERSNFEKRFTYVGEVTQFAPDLQKAENFIGSCVKCGAGMQIQALSRPPDTLWVCSKHLGEGFNLAGNMK